MKNNGGMNQPVISLQEVTKSYGSGEKEVQAINKVSMDIEPGSITGILGPNGAGKTTLIKCILGLIEPSEGTILVNGYDVQENIESVHQNIAAVLEGSRNLYWRLSVLENMRFFSAVSANNPSHQTEYFEQLLDRFDFSHKRDTPIRELSRGQKQKASILCAFARKPEIVFLDEPTLGLDVKSSLNLSNELERMANSQDQTIIVTSHDMATIQDICKRVVILIDGHVEVSATVTELLDRFGIQTYEITVTGRLSTVQKRQLEETIDAKRFRERRSGTQFEFKTDSERFFDVVSQFESWGLLIERVNAIEPNLEEIFLDVTERNERKKTLPR